ncbi:MAG: hypothetical protein R3D00_27935 [Bacteroidia bacterium]
MYTSYIGKKFLKLYKEEYQKPDDYSARQFFDEVMFPLFFEDESHLLHVGNSPFFQKPKESDVLESGGKALAQRNNLRNKIKNNAVSGSIYVGFAAEGMQATSSGQLTNINFYIDEQEIYTSWIGAALGIGVSGGLVMLIDEKEVLLALFHGWEHYRKFLRQTPGVKDKQIETWNGHWLCLYFSNDFDPDFVNYSAIETGEVVGKMAIQTQRWSHVIFSLSKKYPDQTIIAYSYNLSQTNTTLGFINVFLPQVRRLYELRDKIFLNEKDVILKDKEIEKLETFFTFKNACRFGVIGLKALEPAKLREFMPKGSVLYAQGKDFKFTDENSYFTYQLYKLWIIAMLNKTELLQLASDIAAALLEYEKLSEKGKSTHSRLTEEVRTSSNIKTFIDKLTEVLDNASEHAETFKNVVDQVLKMPADNFPLFATLIRFEYTYQKSKI